MAGDPDDRMVQMPVVALAGPPAAVIAARFSAARRRR